MFCRVRPLVGEELYGSDGEIQHMNFPDEDQKVLELEKLGDVSLSEVSKHYYPTKNRSVFVIIKILTICALYASGPVTDTRVRHGELSLFH